MSFSEEALRENIAAFVNALLLAKPVGLKKSKFRSFTRKNCTCFLTDSDQLCVILFSMHQNHPQNHDYSCALNSPIAISESILNKNYSRIFNALQ